MLKKLTVSALLFLNLKAISNNGRGILTVGLKEKAPFHSKTNISQKTTAENKTCKFRFINPFKKCAIPSTYVKFVLKNKKGSFLNIKIGYIS